VVRPAPGDVAHVRKLEVLTHSGQVGILAISHGPDRIWLAQSIMLGSILSDTLLVSSLPFHVATDARFKQRV
jgi:hypothetical protein